MGAMQVHLQLFREVAIGDFSVAGGLDPSIGSDLAGGTGRWDWQVGLLLVSRQNEGGCRNLVDNHFFHCLACWPVSNASCPA